MKFAAIALIASTSAIKIEAEKWCVDSKLSNKIFNEIDTNNNGQLGHKELHTALEHFAKEKHHKPTHKDWEWMGKTFGKDAGKDKTLS